MSYAARQILISDMSHGKLGNHILRNARSSSLTMSACVVQCPCGARNHLQGPVFQRPHAKPARVIDGHDLIGVSLEHQAQTKECIDSPAPIGQATATKPRLSL